MLTRKEISLIRSLEHKKYRDREHLFVAEGPKMVGELAGHLRCRLLLTTDEAAAGQWQADEVRLITPRELGQISQLKTPQGVIGLFRHPENAEPPQADDGLILALDRIQDPGNVGTIVRTADWFGIHTVVCSPDTADVFSPKAVQATMGALARVRVCYTPLPRFLAEADRPVFGTFLNGTDIYSRPLPERAVIVMGNEGQGISTAVASLVTDRIYIPKFPPAATAVESLNVAAATAIACAAFRQHASTR